VLTAALMVVGCGGNPDARNPTTNFHRTLGFNHSVQIAEKEWNHPCDDDITFYLADLPRHSNWATLGQATIGGCQVWIDRRYYATAGFLDLCTTVDHEIGHVAGYGHSKDPSDVMYPTQQMGVYADACLSATLSGVRTDGVARTHW
jgi:hypothetical protein